MKKAVIAIVVLLFLLCFCCLCMFLGMIGVMPGISNFFWKQKDLGVAYDEMLALELYDELGVVDELDTSEGGYSGVQQYDGIQDVEMSLTSEEATALMNYWESRISYEPYKDIQVRFNEDGTVEMSAILLVDKAKEYARKRGYSEDQIDKAAQYLDVLNNEVPIYGKGTGSAENNELDINVSKFQVGVVSVPSSVYAPLSDALEYVLEKQMSYVTNFYIEEAYFENGEMFFKGTTPTRVYPE